MKTTTLAWIFTATIATLVTGCGPDDDPALALDTCNDWCAGQHEQGCGEMGSLENCQSMCKQLHSTLPEACMGEWRVSLECQIDEQCSEDLMVECADDAVDATECIMDERQP